MTGTAAGAAGQEAESAERMRLAVEATRLSFALSSSSVREFVRTAADLRVGGICVPRAFLPEVAARIGSGALGWRPDLVTVANFPTGDHTEAIVREEIAEAVRSGADHVDLVVPGALVAAGDWRGVERFLGAAIAHASEVAGRALPCKVILETAAWDEQRVRSAAGAAVAAGAAWLKTSTGFHPAGGATERAVALLRALAPDGVGVKASGGIRTRAAALAMLAAGADRLGTSAEAVVLSRDDPSEGRDG
jgi:deoxyribose-phosphate aldolase